MQARHDRPLVSRKVTAITARAFGATRIHLQLQAILGLDAMDGDTPSKRRIGLRPIWHLREFSLNCVIDAIKRHIAVNKRKSQAVDKLVLALMQDRSNQLHAYTATMGTELVDAFGRASGEDGIGAIVVMATGRAYCGGMDLSVYGGAIFVGHPFGTTGAGSVRHAQLGGRRHEPKYVGVTLCVSAGMGAPGLAEVF